MSRYLANALTLEYVPVTSITAAASLPSATITVGDTSHFSATGSLTVGASTITYTGKTGTTFTGASGGTGSVSVGDRVSQATFSSLSAHANDAAIEQSLEEVDVTTYGTLDKLYIAGLRDGTFSFMVLYDDGAFASTPQGLISTILNKTVGWRIRPLGSGSGRPEITFDGFITGFNENYANDSTAVGAEISVRNSTAVTRVAQS